MGKKQKTVTEFQSAIKRLEYLAAKKEIMKGYNMADCHDAIARELGLKKRIHTGEDGEEKIKYVYVDDSYRSMSDVYAKEYAAVAKKLNDFYRAINSLSTNRLKDIAERRYIEGESLKDIADVYDVSLPTMYAYRDVIAKVLKENGCAWFLSCDY